MVCLGHINFSRFLIAYDYMRKFLVNRLHLVGHRYEDDQKALGSFKLILTPLNSRAFFKNMFQKTVDQCGYDGIGPSDFGSPEQATDSLSGGPFPMHCCYGGESLRPASKHSACMKCLWDNDGVLW